MDLRLSISEQGCDLVLENGALVVEHGLETAVLLSLFVDRRARELPPGETDPRGWWAEAKEDRWGSQLWTLSRAKLTRQTIERARAFALEALNWLVEDGILERVEVAVLPSTSSLLLEVQLVRGSATRWPSVWEATAEKTYKPEPGVEVRLLPL